MTRCGYSLSSATGPCEGKLLWTVRNYFTSGKNRDMALCEKHAANWNEFHPLGPIATKRARQIKKENGQ